MKKVNHREKNKKIAVSIITCLFLMIISISIAYAALSETLTIAGSGKVQSSRWDVKLHFYNAINYGTATYTTPVINGTSATYSVNLKKPGDKIIMHFRMSNTGTLNAELASIVSQTPTCTSSTGNTTDENLVCNNLDITIAYDNGATIEVGNVINTTSFICTNGLDYTYNNPNIKIIISLKDSMTEVPSSNVTISNIKYDFVYTQTDKKCDTRVTCFVAGTKVLTENGYKNIEDIKVDDYIYALNQETNQYELRKVLQKFDSKTTQIYKIHVAGRIIETTPRHEFYVVDKGWIRAYDLKVGDKLSSKETDDTTITKIELKDFEEPIPVYNMEVEGHHNYLITEDNLLVHNADSPSF